MTPMLGSNALTKTVFGVGFAALIAVAVFAQNPATYKMPDLLHMKTSPERDDLWLSTRVGSFKLLPRGDVMPSGTLTMSFTGSVLSSDLKGQVIPEGSVRKEYDNSKKGKQVWFGTGKLTITGAFMAVQWFGRNLDAKFNGNGFIRLYGEFDKNLDTGYYWFDPKDKKFWGTYGNGVGIPEMKSTVRPNDVKTRQEFEKKGKGGG
ncbi:MAG: hypothetical protein IT203_10640 [Fimbriimonadaceae bacterium]|nr:hypothetical protein [Fimbriimonadaceae bacterium]